MHPKNKKIKDLRVCKYCSHTIHYKDTYCSGCKIYIANGNKTVKRKNKELAIKTLLEQNDISATNDVTVQGGCSRKRPDFIIKTAWGTIILEVDEHQHIRSYPCECEVQRMKMIYFDVGERNLLFIRYNPDKYDAMEAQQFTTLQRREFLIKFLKEQIDKPSFKKLGVVYLFYDKFVPTAVEIEQFDPYKKAKSYKPVKKKKKKFAKFKKKKL